MKESPKPCELTENVLIADEQFSLGSSNSHLSDACALEDLKRDLIQLLTARTSQDTLTPLSDEHIALLSKRHGENLSDLISSMAPFIPQTAYSLILKDIIEPCYQHILKTHGPQAAQKSLSDLLDEVDEPVELLHYIAVFAIQTDILDIEIIKKLTTLPSFGNQLQQIFSKNLAYSQPFLINLGRIWHKARELDNASVIYQIVNNVYLMNTPNAIGLINEDIMLAYAYLS